MTLRDISDPKKQRETAALAFKDAYRQYKEMGLDEESIINGILMTYGDKELFKESFDFVVGDGKNAKIDCPKLEKYFRSHERYFFVAGDYESARAIRYLYDAKAGIYRDVSDVAFKARIKEYIEKGLPENVKSRDIQEAFTLISLQQCYKLADDIDANEDIVNFRNGILNIRTGEFSEHTPDVFSSIQLNAEYHDGKQFDLERDAPTFNKYLTRLVGDKETDAKKALLLEYMGAIISNVAGYRFKKCLFLYGEKGDEGKSQYINLIAHILGDRNCQPVKFPNLDDRFAASSFFRKRLVHGGDVIFNNSKTNEKFMMMTGGDSIDVEIKGMTGFSAKYKGLMLFSSNYMPTWGGNKSNAAYRRLIIVSCPNPIPINEQDPTLFEKMTKERDAIVYVALQHLKNALNRNYRFTETEDSAAMVAKSRAENQPALQFFRECCEQNGKSFTGDHGGIEKCTRIHNVYKAWFAEQHPDGKCAISGFAEEIARELGKADKSEIITKKHGTRYYMFALTKDAKETYPLQSIGTIDEVKE